MRHPIRAIRQFLDRLGSEKLRRSLIPVLVMLVLGGIWLFLEIASEIRENETRHFDEAVIHAVRGPGTSGRFADSPRAGEIARDLTALGGVTVLTLVVLVSLGVAVFAGRARLAMLAVVHVLAGTWGMHQLKQGYDRPRPEFMKHETVVFDASFPSGHSMMSAVVYLTLGILLARTQAKHRVRVFIVAISAVATLLVGISRIHLGVHWPTDVLGGWALGGAWAVIFWLVAMKIDPRDRPPA